MQEKSHFITILWRCVLCCRDTLFFEDFNLKELIGRFHKFKESDAEANMVLFVTCKDEGKF